MNLTNKDRSCAAATLSGSWTSPGLAAGFIPANAPEVFLPVPRVADDAISPGW